MAHPRKIIVPRVKTVAPAWAWTYWALWFVGLMAVTLWH